VWGRHFDLFRLFIASIHCCLLMKRVDKDGDDDVYEKKRDTRGVKKGRHGFSLDDTLVSVAS